MTLTLIRETRDVWPVDFDPDIEGPVGTETVYVLTVDDDRYEFSDVIAAHAAMDAVDAALRAGRSVWPCSWVVPRFHPEPDFPSDLLGECGAPSFEHADGRGFSCVAGHRHRSGAEYYEADEAASYTSRGIPLAPNARLMDGSEIR